MSSQKFYAKFGHPKHHKDMVIWDVPFDHIAVLPKRLYCNKALINPLNNVFKELIESDLIKELKTFDGCFNFRSIRGYEKKYNELMKSGKEAEAIKYLSVHSWGCAIDVNASENGLGKLPKLSHGFVDIFKRNGFVWGGDFKRKDGMHFELSKV